MSEFFRGWRRKVGCVSLILACGLMVGWIRSDTKFDEAFINMKPWLYGIASAGGRMHFFRGTHERNSPLLATLSFDLEKMGGFAVDQQGSRTFDPMKLAIDVNWKWRWGPFEIADGMQTSKVSSRWLSISYWLLILPLTLLSTSLLLHRRQPVKLQPKQPFHASLSQLRPDPTAIESPSNRWITCATDVASGPLR